MRENPYLPTKIDRLLHRYRLVKNLGLEDDIIPIAIQIAETLLQEDEHAYYRMLDNSDACHYL